MGVRRHPISPFRLYLLLESGMSFLLGIAYATITVYWVTSGRLNPLQLVLLGTALDCCERYFPAFQFVVWAGKGAREALDAAMFETAGEA